MKNKIKYLFTMLIITFTLIIILSSENLRDLPKLLLNTNLCYLSLAISMLFADWIFDGLILNSIVKIIHGKVSYLKSLKIAIIGQYYGAITPFATGGQPVQVYLMSKDSISVAKGSLILFNKFIIRQMAVTFYSLFMFIFKMNFLLNCAKTALPFVIIGFILNVFVLIGIVLLFYKPKWVKKIVLGVCKILNKFGIVKNLEKSVTKINNSMQEYVINVRKVKGHKKENLIIFVLTIVQLTLSFSITYFVYLALGLEGSKFMDIIAIQCLVYMAASYIPTPGTTGASEGGYYLLFKHLFSKNLIMYALLLWRAISYYLRLILTGIITLIDYIKRNKNKAVA